MNAMSELTIVIPAKNEAKLIPHLLTSLLLQDYEPMPTTKVYLADANSNDATPPIACSNRREATSRSVRACSCSLTEPGSMRWEDFTNRHSMPRITCSARRLRPEGSESCQAVC